MINAPALLNVNLANLKPEGIAEVPATLTETFTVDLISDLGSNILYNDAIENKDVVEPNHRKFLTSTLQVTVALGVTAYKMKDFYSYPNPVKSTLNIVFGETPFLKTTCFIYNNLGELVKKRKC